MKNINKKIEEKRAKVEIVPEKESH